MRAVHDRERSIYACAAIAALFAAGATFWKGREVYRHLYMHQSNASTTNLIIILVSILVIQIAYWSVLHAPPPFVIRKKSLHRSRHSLFEPCQLHAGRRAVFDCRSRPARRAEHPTALTSDLRRRPFHDLLLLAMDRAARQCVRPRQPARRALRRAAEPLRRVCNF
jgi:hypothetical protein